MPYGQGGGVSPAGRQVENPLPCSLLHTIHPDLPGSQEDMRPVPVPSQVSQAQLELQVIGSSLSTGVGSAAFTGPIKHHSLPLQHTARPGNLSLLGQGG